jgi:hypothetical protein
MPNTSRGLPYPSPTVPPNVPVDIQALAEALDAWLPKQATVITNQILTANSTTLQNVTGMALALGVGTWILDVYLAYNSPAAADIKLATAAFTGTTSSASKFCMGPGTGTTDVAANTTMRCSAHGSSSAVTYGHDGTASNGFAHETHRLVVTAAGTIQIQAAQNAANAGVTSIIASSFMEARRVA